MGLQSIVKNTHTKLLGLTIDVVLKMWRNCKTNLRMIQNVLLSLDSLFAVLMLR